MLAVEPGDWIVLEDIVCGDRSCVRSANVSREAVRWDILLGRVMGGDPESLWGPARLFAPDEEPELLAELQRRAGVDVAGAGANGKQGVTSSSLVPGFDEVAANRPLVGADLR